MKPESSPGERARIDSALAQVRALGPPPALPDIAGYVLEAELGRGGQGVVYRARQSSTGRAVALKLLREEVAGERSRPRFEREVAVLSALEHPALVRILDCGLHAGRFFYAMEFVEGRDLEQELAARPRSLRERVALLTRVVEAVAAAHQRGVLHRDLKPSNIRIDPRGEPRLVDFGLARWLGEVGQTETLTEDGAFVGSVPWASPEQVEGAPIDVRSDVYALGVVLYQALTTRFPYDVDGPLARVFEAIRNEAPRDPRRLEPLIDRDLATILARALEKDPGRRYPTALDLARDLESWLTHRPIAARRASPFYVFRKALERRPWTSAGAGVAVMALCAALFLLVQQRGELRATIRRLEARLHAEELRTLAQALESGDGPRLREALAAIPSARRDWLVRHHAQALAARTTLYAEVDERPLALACAPNGDGLAFGTWQGTVRLLERNGEVRWTSAAEFPEVRDLAFDAGGEILALASRSLARLRADDGAELARFEWPEGGLERLSPWEGGAVLASAAGTVVAVPADFTAPSRVMRLRHASNAGPGARSGIELTAVSGAGARIATVGDGALRLWGLADGRELARVSLQPFEGLRILVLAFSAAGSASRSAIRTWIRVPQACGSSMRARERGSRRWKTSSARRWRSPSTTNVRCSALRTAPSSWWSSPAVACGGSCRVRATPRTCSRSGPGTARPSFSPSRSSAWLCPPLARPFTLACRPGLRPSQARATAHARPPRQARESRRTSGRSGCSSAS